MKIDKKQSVRIVQMHCEMLHMMISLTDQKTLSKAEYKINVAQRVGLHV